MTVAPITLPRLDATTVAAGRRLAGGWAVGCAMRSRSQASPVNFC